MTAVGSDATVKGDYLQIPLLAAFEVPLADASPVALQIFFGPTGIDFDGYATGTTTIKGDPQGIQVAGTLEGSPVAASCDDLGAQRRKYDYGVMLGGGVGYHLRATTVFLTAAYDYGLRDLDTEEANVSTMKHRTLAFSIGFLVPVFGRGR